MNCACIASLCAVCSCISLAVMEASEDDDGSGLVAVAAAAAAAAAADWSSQDMSSLAAADVELWAARAHVSPGISNLMFNLGKIAPDRLTML